jgi:hypothetical protein
VPVSCARYAGIKGKTQGERNDSTPAPKAINIPNVPISISLTPSKKVWVETHYDIFDEKFIGFLTASVAALMKLQFSDREGVFGRGEASQENPLVSVIMVPGMLRPYFVLRHAEIFPVKSKA